MSDYNNELFPDNPPVRSNILTFGKHKGKPVEFLLNDPNYCEWLLSTDWFQSKHPLIYQVIINNFGEPNDTPEHNALQARFLDDSFCLAFASLYNWLPVNKSFGLKKTLNDLNDIESQLHAISVSNASINSSSLSDYMNLSDAEKKLFSENNYNRTKLLETQEQLIKNKEYLSSENTTYKINKEFEKKGWDIAISFCHLLPYYWVYNKDLKDLDLSIEIKPFLGDNYPSILRQMKSYNRTTSKACLVYDKFSATNISLEQIKDIFLTANICIFSISEIEAATKLLPYST
jgi:hypothetical protein